MSQDNLHRIVFLRLCLAWAVISTLVAGVVFYVETEKIDERVLQLATEESRKFTPPELHSGGLAPEALAALRQRAEDFVHDHFVVIELYDLQKHKLLEAVSRDHQELEETLARNKHPFPRDGRSHYEKFEYQGDMVLQVLVPVNDTAGQLTGYFEGVYVVDRATLQQLKQDLARAVTIALLTVALTTLILYPVILNLHRRVLRFAQRVAQGNIEMAAVLGAAIALRDADTSDHNYRVTLYAIRLGEAVGVRGPAMRGLILGAFLHDVGKIGISDNILLKPGRLTPEEFDIMRTHVALGVQIVAESEWLQQAREVIEFHHEKWNGSGYLQGLAGEAIPLNARIFALVDVFDALTSRRPYKEPMSVDTALAILQKDAGSHFDPQLTTLFCALAPQAWQDIATAPPDVLIAQLKQYASTRYRQDDEL